MQFSFRTSPPPTYITPSGEEMREAAKAVGLGSFSRDLVADLCNVAAGGGVNPPSAYRDQVRQKVEETLPTSDSSGNWSVPSLKDKGLISTKDRMTAIHHFTEKKMKYHQNVCDFLQTVDLNQFPGGSPLEQAMSLLKLLSKQQGGQGGGEAGEPLPIFTDNDNPESIAEQLHDVMDMVDSLSDEEQDMLDPEGKNHDVNKEADGQRSGDQGLNKLKVAEDLLPGSDKRVMLDISRKLDQFTKLQVRRQRTVQPDPEGDEVRNRPIRHLGELGKVSKSAWGLHQENSTYFLYQAVTGQLPVRERVTRIERRQAIFILVDGSGSMRGERHFKASGVVMNRLKAVISGDAEVWVSVFDTSMTKPSKASTPEEARELVKKFTNGNFKGGGTDIAAAIRSAHKFIEEQIRSGAALYRPEIVVLTDDDTSVSAVKAHEISGTRVHGFAMNTKNQSLVALAKSTGGVSFENF